MEMKKIHLLKQWLLARAVEIRETRKIYKDEQRKSGWSYLAWGLQTMSREYRHHHIAYSELRGKTRDQIEKPRENNLPDEDIIKSIKAEYLDEQAVCISA